MDVWWHRCTFTSQYPQLCEHHKKWKQWAHPDKNHVMLTGPASILPQPLSPETLERAECIYTLTFNAISQHPFSLDIVYGNKACQLLFLQQHKWLKCAGWVFSAWKEGCVTYRRLWQNCPEWVLSLSTTTVNSSDTPWDPHNYTLLIPSLPYSCSTHSTACSFTANYRTSLNKAHVPSPPLPVSHFRVMITVCFS